MENGHKPSLENIGLEEIERQMDEAPDRKITNIPEAPLSNREMLEGTANIITDFDLPEAARAGVYERNKESIRLASREGETLNTSLTADNYRNSELKRAQKSIEEQKALEASRPQMERRERKEASPIDLFVLEFSNAVKAARLTQEQQSAALDKIRDMGMRVSDPDSRKQTIEAAIQEVKAPAPAVAEPIRKVA